MKPYSLPYRIGWRYNQGCTEPCGFRCGSLASVYHSVCADAISCRDRFKQSVEEPSRRGIRIAWYRGMFNR